MRTIITIIVCLIALGANAQSTNIRTETFAVRGNCEECKARIENAADIKGVKVATWSEDKQALTVTYNSDKTSLLQVQLAIAANGHDVAGVGTDESRYNKLPACCKYRDNKCQEKK